MPIRIAIWNLNHRTREKTVPGRVPEVMAGLDAALWAITEFVDGPSRSGFHEQLGTHGPHCLLAGAHGSGALSDHAVLMVEMDVPTVAGFPSATEVPTHAP